MLLTKGVIRVGLPVPANAEFVLAEVVDPYGYAGHNTNGMSCRSSAARSRRRTYVSQHRHVGRAETLEGFGGGDQPTWRTSRMPRRKSHAQAPNPIEQSTRS
jgi:hypothetical protein